MSERVAFACPLPPRGLRRNSLARSTGWRGALVREYQEQVWCAAIDARWTDRNGKEWAAIAWPRSHMGMPWERAVLRLEWHHAGVAPDADNALASLKPLIDVLHTRSGRPLGIVVDDGPAHLRIEPVALVKVQHRTEECVIVTVTKEEA